MNSRSENPLFILDINLGYVFHHIIYDNGIVGIFCVIVRVSVSACMVNGCLCISVVIDVDHIADAK